MSEINPRLEDSSRSATWDVACFIVILLASVLALGALFRPGIAGSDDILDSIYRTVALDLSWQRGILYPRLSADLAYAYSAPLFLYYPPLASFVAQLFHLAGLGFIGSIKATFFLALLFSGLGMGVLVKAMLGTRAGALLAALAYIFAPYQLLDVYQRGATAESLALALLPWILWAAYRLCLQPGPKWFLLTSVSTAALLLTHNSTALFFLPVLAGYVILNALLSKKQSAAVLGLAAIGVALGLSAFFWLPALAERSYVSINALVTGAYDPRHNLVSVGELIQRSWLFEYDPPNGFRWGLASMLFVVVSVIALPKQPKTTRVRLLFFVLLLSISLILQLSLAYLFWDKVPLVRFIQFPWRLMAFVYLSGAILIGSLATVAVDWRRRPFLTSRLAPKGIHAGVVFACTIALLLGTAALARLWPGYASAWRQGHFAETDIGRFDMYERGRLGFELFSDYQPIWANVAMSELPNGLAESDHATEPALDSVPRVHVLESGPLSMKLAIDTDTTLPLSFHWFYFPGWQVRVDGREVQPYPSDELGLLAIDLAPGKHTVELRYRDTFVRRAASFVSLLSALICIGIAGWLVRKSSWRAAVLALAVGMVLVVLLPLRAEKSAVRGDIGVNLENQALLVGYSLDKQSYQPGDTVHVSLFWLGLTGIPEDYKVFVHLRNTADTQMVGQHDGYPVYGFTPTSRWKPGELLVDEHALVLPSDLPPGRYSLVAGMYQADTLQNLAPLEATRVLPGNRIFVTDVEVSQ